MPPAPCELASFSLMSLRCVHAWPAVLRRRSRQPAAQPTAGPRHGLRRRTAAQQGPSWTAPFGMPCAAPPTAPRVRMQQQLVPRVLLPDRLKSNPCITIFCCLRFSVQFRAGGGELPGTARPAAACVCAQLDTIPGDLLLWSAALTYVLPGLCAHFLTQQTKSRRHPAIAHLAMPARSACWRTKRRSTTAWRPAPRRVETLPAASLRCAPPARHARGQPGCRT